MESGSFFWKRYEGLGEQQRTEGDHAIYWKESMAKQARWGGTSDI